MKILVVSKILFSLAFVLNVRYLLLCCLMLGERGVEATSLGWCCYGNLVVFFLEFSYLGGLSLPYVGCLSSTKCSCSCSCSDPFGGSRPSVWYSFSYWGYVYCSSSCYYCFGGSLLLVCSDHVVGWVGFSFVASPKVGKVGIYCEHTQSSH